MNIIAMSGKVLSIPNPVIGKSSLPNLPASKLDTERMRISALNKLDRLFQGDIEAWRKQQMQMLRHEDKRMHLESTLPSVTV